MALKKSNLQKAVKHGSGSVIVWGCFTAYGVDKITFIADIMPEKIYIDILDDCLMKSILNFGLSRPSIFQKGNDPNHVSKLA